MDRQDLNALRSVEELANYQKDVRARITGLDTEFRGLPFPDEAREEYAGLKDEDKEIEARKTELIARQKYAQQIAEGGNRTERVDDDVFRTERPSVREQDIYDLSTIPFRYGSHEQAGQVMRDRALRAVELRGSFAGRDKTEAQAHVIDLIDNHDDEQGSIAQRVLQTGSPVYKRAFMKATVGRPLTSEEQRALSLTSANGGYAVPFDLDPTIIGTSSGSINPLRQISRVIPITGDEWRGVTSAGITTAYAAEATETTDNAPTLGPATISTEKAQAFIPFSIEIGMDWQGMQADLARLLQESKDDLEATKFTVGSGTNEPFGVITGATTTVNATAAGVFDLEDLYRLAAALPPRHRPNASFMGELTILNKIRQFDTAGGAGIWADNLTLGNPAQLLGRPVYENSAMATVTTVGALFLIVGDFSRFVIVDRIGLQVELIQHLVGTNHRPTGQRGLYAFWRNGSKVVDAGAFRVLIGLA
jgi:HK97 family phage major capsid protein